MGGVHPAGAGMEWRIAEAARDMRPLAHDSLLSRHRIGYCAVQVLLRESGAGILVPSARGRFHVS